jgi:hypothetical protein
VPSPFESPAFWELTAQDTPRIMDAIPPRPTPPVWDPLGVAPFAWELPEPPTAARSRRLPAAPALQARHPLAGGDQCGGTRLRGTSRLRPGRLVARGDRLA